MIDEPQTTYIVEHGGNTYLFDSHGNGKTEIDFIGYFNKDGKQNDYWRYSVYGAHEGKPITLDILNPHVEYDEGTPYIAHDGIVWADNDESICATVSDWYSDGITDDVREMFKNW